MSHDTLLCGECALWCNIHKNKDGRKVGTCIKTEQSHYRTHWCNVTELPDETLMLGDFVKGKQITAREVMEIVRLRRHGLSLKEIAQRTRRGKGYIFSLLRDIKSLGVIIDIGEA